MFEATEYNILGIRLSLDDVSKLREAFMKAYEDLARDRRWEDINFCKRQIGYLWDAIIDMLEKLSEELAQGKQPILDSRSIKEYLLIDTDNGDFLNALGKYSNDVVREILGRFKEEFTARSLRSTIYDHISGERMHIKIDPSRIMQKIGWKKERTRKMLQQFVEWVKGRGRPFITCMLVAGLFTVALVAGIWIGITMPATRPFIMATIAIVCWIAETAGMVDSVLAAKNLLRWRGAGIELEVEKM